MDRDILIFESLVDRKQQQVLPILSPFYFATGYHSNRFSIAGANAVQRFHYCEVYKNVHFVGLMGGTIVHQENRLKQEHGASIFPSGFLDATLPKNVILGHYAATAYP